MNDPGTIENGVLVGNDGQLFLAGGAHNVLDYVTGRLHAPESSYAAFEKNVERRAAFANKAGIPYRHIVHPDKQSVLLDAFPFDAPVCLGEMYLSRCARVSEHILYPREALRRAGHASFLHTDTHLSDRGSAWVAAAVVTALLGPQVSLHAHDLLDRTTSERIHCGDLGSKLTPPQSSPERFIDQAWGARLVSNRLARNDGIVDIWLSPRALFDKRLLVFGDSFGRHLAGMMSYFFSETVFLRTPFFHPDIAAQIRPDCLLTQNVERYLTYVRDDTSRPSFFMYPFLSMEVATPQPDPGFGEIFSALLSHPRKPYQDYRQKYFPKLGTA